MTELAREQPMDSSLTNTKSNSASAVVSAANTGVLPSPDVLNSLDMIHSWLQQSEKQAVTESMDTMTSVKFTHTSNLPSAGSSGSQSKQLPLSTSSWQTVVVNVSTVRCFIFIRIQFYIYPSAIVRCWRRDVVGLSVHLSVRANESL